MLKWIILAIVVLIVIAVAGVVFWVQTEAPFHREHISQGSGKRALILYHPSRDAHFSDDLTMALARGFAEADFPVDRWTMTSRTPSKPKGYAIVAVVSNTFFSAPDWPTLRYLKRARLEDQNVIAIMAGGGKTERAEQKLGFALERTGAHVLDLRPLWTTRPNEPGSEGPANRQVAMKIARSMAREAGQLVRERNATAADQAPATRENPVQPAPAPTNDLPQGAEARETAP
ncbi:hypothetical protein EKN06_05360 [Croceicoccus ponticola]|uniref:Flavodoxin-like domain-containing protein n=1 Tax=Croceicoccus ponticola TaxID=2217664 RepID=A0A437H257_9SPHN|nr:hypothetical protein [Croceicoccus ponticola]RVQ69592.1 hypothetical protein EKN06_05360 [Croceicoccus ponticola]